MIITELELKHFGKFEHRKLTLQPGLNVLYGTNESGKTTLHTFIRCMLYGMKRQRGRAAARDVCSRYEPWDNPSYYAGLLRFMSGGKVFRITRSFQRRNQRSQLVCESDGEQLSVEKGDLQILLGGVGEVVFENTFCIGQLKSRTDAGLAGELRNYLVNYRESSMGSLDVEEALANLEKRRRLLVRQQKNEGLKLQEQLSRIRGRLEYLEEEAASLEGQIRQQETETDRMLRQEIDTPDAGKVIEGNLRQLGLVGIAVFVAAFVLLRELRPLFWIVLVSGLMAALGPFIRVLWQKRREKERSLCLQQQRKEWQAQQAGRLAGLKEALAEKQRELENLREEYGEVAGRCGEGTELSEEIRAVDLAVRTIRELSEEHNWLSEELQTETGRLLCRITGGRYRTVTFAESGLLGVDTGEQLVQPEQLSQGTVEQIYFAFRMAAGSLLCREEELPVMLDDAFVMYDERRLLETLKWLAGCGRQVLLFTCHTREEQLLEGLGVPYHRIDLEDV